MSDPKLICGMNYIPYTELRVPSTRIAKAKFPVFESHAHLGKLVIGDNYDTLYDMDTLVETLKTFGIYKVINLDGFWGEELDRMLKNRKIQRRFCSYLRVCRCFGWTSLPSKKRCTER